MHATRGSKIAAGHVWLAKPDVSVWGVIRLAPAIGAPGNHRCPSVATQIGTRGSCSVMCIDR